MPFFESKLLNKTLNIKILKKLCIPWKLSCEYFFSEGVPLKSQFMSVFLHQRQVIQKVGLIGQLQ
jgi:hypothetical protein